MERSESSGLYSPLSITKELWPWCLWVICLLTVAWTAVVAWAEISGGKRASLLETAVAVVSGASGGVPLIVIYSILIVIVGNFILGGGIMVMARAAKQYLDAKIEKQRERFREQGREEGREQGREQGKADERRAWVDWNTRRLEAEARGEPFDEPPPGV